MSDWDQFSKSVSEEFGNRLRQNRGTMKQGDLAKKLNLQRTSITNMENGKQTPSLTQVLAIAQALGIQPIELIPNVHAPVDAPTDYAEKIERYLQVRDRVMKRANNGV